MEVHVQRVGKSWRSCHGSWWWSELTPWVIIWILTGTVVTRIGRIVHDSDSDSDNDHVGE